MWRWPWPSPLDSCIGLPSGRRGGISRPVAAVSSRKLPRPCERREVTLPLEALGGVARGRPRLVAPAGLREHLREVEQCIGLRVEQVGPLGDRHGLARGRLGRFGLAASREHLRARAPPEHLREDVLLGSGLLTGAAELVGLVVLTELAEGMGEQAGDRRAEAALAHPAQGLVALPQRPGGRCRVAGEHLHEERLLPGDGDPNRLAELVEGPPPGGQQIARGVEVAAHRLEHGPLAAAEGLRCRLAGRGLRELLAALDAPLHGQRAEGRADQEPADALGLLGAEASTLRAAKRLVPGALGGAEAAEHAAVEPPLQVPGLREAVVVAELLARAQRLADVVLEPFALPAQDAERAEPQQRARRTALGKG